MKRVALCLAAAAALTITAVSAFAQPSSIEIENSWTRATPAGATAGMVFMTISNRSDATDRLIGASSDARAKDRQKVRDLAQHLAHRSTLGAWTVLDKGSLG